MNEYYKPHSKNLIYSSYNLKNVLNVRITSNAQMNQNGSAAK